MIWTILLVIAVFLLILSILNIVDKYFTAKITRTRKPLIIEETIITITLSYIIWYCN